MNTDPCSGLPATDTLCFSLGAVFCAAPKRMSNYGPAIWEERTPLVTLQGGRRARRGYEIARSREVVQGSFKLAALVGTILVAVNYEDRFLVRQANGTDFAKRELTVAVPCCA